MAWKRALDKVQFLDLFLMLFSFCQEYLAIGFGAKDWFQEWFLIHQSLISLVYGNSDIINESIRILVIISMGTQKKPTHS